MPLSQLLMGLLGAAIAFAAAMLLGWEFWAALLAYVVVGNAVFLGSVVIVALREAARPATHRARADRPLQPVPAKR